MGYHSELDWDLRQEADQDEPTEPTLEQLEESLKVFEEAGDTEMVYELRGHIRRLKNG